FRKYGHRGRGGVDASLVLGGGHALHAMHTGLPAHRAESTLADDLDRRLTNAAERTLGEGDDFDAPSVPRNEALVHAVEIGRAQRGLLDTREMCVAQRGVVATRSREKLGDAVGVVERVARNERGTQLRLEVSDGAL